MRVGKIERLINRYLDGELTQAEEQRLRQLLEENPDYKKKFHFFQRLDREARRLPSFGFPARLVEEILAKAESPSPPFWRRGLDFLLKPRYLKWNYASLGGTLALIIIILASGVPMVAPGWKNYFFPIRDATGGEKTIYVRLIFLAEDARSVSVAGSFNNWEAGRLQLFPKGDGVWGITLELRPGRYQYMFVVDGKWVPDPLADLYVDDGFGNKNAVLDL